MKLTAHGKLAAVAMIFIAMASGRAAFAGENKLYAADPASIPAWVEQGMFHFIRIDGGRIESMKAERTWWGKDFTTEEKEVLSNIYGKYSDKIIAKLKEAGFNWVWVTWSNGWSFKEEADSREQLKGFIERCHEQGIKVTAYLSATNIFWENMFIDEPQSVTWLLIKDKMPVFYGGNSNPMRFIANAGNPDWRAYMVGKSKTAVEAGADAIFYDNIIGDEDGLRLLLSETQQMADAYARHARKQKALLYANVHMDVDRLDMNDECELLWDEEGKNTPGVWPSGWETANARKIKFLYGTKQPWQPLKYEYDLYHCGPRETCIPSPDEQKLSIAEEYSFGAGLSRNIEGRFLKALIMDEKEALDAWAAIRQYNTFITAHSDLYNRVSPVPRIGVISETDDSSFADALIRRSVMFDLKTISRLDAGVPLSSLKAIVIPYAPFSMTVEQADAIRKFAAAGGKVFAAPPVASRGWDKQVSKQDKDKLSAFYKEINAEIIPAAVMSRIDKGGDIADFISKVVEESGGPVVTLDNAGHTLANVTRKNGAAQYIVHLVNYDFDKAAENVRVSLDAGGTNGCDVQLLSPDAADIKADAVSANGGKCIFTVKKIERYVIAVATPSR